MHIHNHSHDNESQIEQSDTRIGIAFVLNLCFTIIEFIGGWLTQSTAIMADAVHDLGDSLSIGLAWVLNKISHKEATPKFSYGYQRFSLLGALINGVVLIVGSIWVLSEAIPKLFDPQMPVVSGMLALSVLGVTVNGFAAYKLSHGKTLNEKVLNWHLLEDVLGWLAVLIVSITLHFFDWPILDPLLSVVFTLFILTNVVRTLWQAIKLFMQASPNEELYQTIKKILCQFGTPHHFHLWSLDGENHVLTTHIVLDEEINENQYIKIKQRIASALEPFELTHTTIELEYRNEECRDKH